MTASNDCGEPQCLVQITPKSYWDSEGCAYDDHIFDDLSKNFPLVKSLGPDIIEELEEGSFEINDKNLQTCLSINDTIETLCKIGIKPCIGFQNFMSQVDTQTLTNIVTQLGYQNLILQ